MRKYVADAKAKGVTAVILSPVPRNIWKEGKVVRAEADYGLWAKETAASISIYWNLTYPLRLQVSIRQTS